MPVKFLLIACVIDTFHINGLHDSILLRLGFPKPVAVVQFKSNFSKRTHRYYCIILNINWKMKIYKILKI